MVSIMCLRGVGLFWSTKSNPALWATSRKRISVNAESGLRSDFFWRTCGNKEAQARARKSLRLPIQNGPYISRIVTGLRNGVQNFSRYFREIRRGLVFL